MGNRIVVYFWVFGHEEREKMEGEKWGGKVEVVTCVILNAPGANFLNKMIMRVGTHQHFIKL